MDFNSVTLAAPRIRLRPMQQQRLAQLQRIADNLPDPELIRAEIAKRALHEYIRQAWHVLEPETPFLDNWHIGAICEHLQAQTLGQIQKLLINVPFKMMKSLTVCVFWPSWEWLRAAHVKWLFTSYADALSLRDSVKCRTLIESPWYQRRWGYLYQLTTDQNTKSRYENDKRGVRMATSFEGLGTGEGGNRVVVDDAHNMKQIMSDTIRTETIRVWKESLSSRRNDPRTDTFTGVMQRGHEKDWSGYILTEETGWEHLCLPMEYEPKRMVFVRQPDGSRIVKQLDVSQLKTSIGFADPRRQEGELLHPTRFPPAVVTQMKTSLGTYGASGQLQQRPTPATGGMFPRERWCRYRRRELPSAFDAVIQSWDMAFKKTDDSSKVAGQVWARKGANKYLLARVCKRMDFPESLRAVVWLSQQHPEAALKLVEDKANGPAVIAMLRNKVVGLKAWPPAGTQMESKEARAQAASVHQESQNLYLPVSEEAPWVDEFIELAARVPKTDEWDDVDAMSQAMEYFGPALPLELLLGAEAFGGEASKIAVDTLERTGVGHMAESTDAPWNL